MLNLQSLSVQDSYETTQQIYNLARDVGRLVLDRNDQQLSVDEWNMVCEKVRLQLHLISTIDCS